MKLSRSFSVFLIFLCAGGLFIHSRIKSGAIRFHLEDLRVVSESADVESRVRSQMKAYLGESLFSLRLSEIRKKLLAIPRIESLEIHRRWPDTLIVEIVERDAVALAFRGEELSLLDREGNWIEGLRVPRGLPLIVGTKFDSAPMKEICAWLYAIQGAADPDLLSYNKIDEVYWTKEAGLRVRSASLGLTVFLGYTDFPARWELAQRAYFFSYQRGKLARKIDADNLRRVILSADETAKIPTLPVSTLF